MATSEGMWPFFLNQKAFISVISGMIRISLFPLAAFFLLLSCKKDQVIHNIPVVIDTTRTDSTMDTTIHNDTTSIHNDSTAHLNYYLALGDSYTIGQSVPESDRYPVQTTGILIQKNENFSAPEIIARTGWTTTNLINAINTTPPSRSSYDIVTLLIGVNNQYQGLSKTQYRDEFTQLLNRAIQYAGDRKQRVIVLSIPDYSVTPFASGSNKAFISSEIDSFNAINKDITLSMGVHYVDITPSTRQAASDPSLVAGDGLHPSGKEYKKWADMLVPVIQAAIR